MTDDELLAQLNSSSQLSDDDLLSILNAGNAQSQAVPTTGWAGIKQDITSSFASAPGALYEGLKALPGAAYASGEQLVSDPERALRNAMLGIMKGGRGIINLPHNTYSYLGEKEIPVFKEMMPYMEMIHLEETAPERILKEKLGHQQAGDVLFQGLGEFSPYSRIGAGMKGAKGLAQRTGGAGLMGVGSEEINPIHAALFNVGGEGAIKAAQAAKNFKPINMLQSPLDAQQLQRALDVTRGTETSLGSVLENPLMKSTYENFIAEVPFSGAQKSMKNTAIDIQKKGENILNQLAGDIPPQDIGLELFNALADSYNNTKDIKTAKFNVVNDLAEQSGFVLKRENLRNTANKILSEVKTDPDLAAIRKSPEMSLIQQIAKNPDDYYSLRDTDFLRGEIGDALYDAYASNQTGSAKKLGELKTAIDKDIDMSIDKSNITELKAARKEAMSWYKENFAPFEDKQISKFLRGGADIDTLPSYFVKTGARTDRARLVEKLQSKLPEQDKNLLAYSYFTEAINPDGTFNPNKFNMLYKKLGDRQKQALIPNQDIRNELSNYNQLANKNSEALNLMANPKTGYRLADLLAGGAALGGLFTGHIPAVAATGILAKGANELLTNPAIREYLVTKLMKEKANPKAYKPITESSQFLTRGAPLSMENENE